MQKYNSQFKILFTWNPMAQVTIGRFFGYMLMFDTYADTIDYQIGDEVLFHMSSASQWNKCIKHIQNVLKAN